MADEFEALLNDSGVFQAQVMTWLLTDEVAENLMALWCSHCDTELVTGELVYAWGEPFGDAHVAIKTHCSDDCTVQSVHDWIRQTRPDLGELEIYVTYYAMNWRPKEE